MYRSVIIERYFSFNHPSLSAFSIFPVLHCLLQIQDFAGIFWSLYLFMLFLLDKMFVNCDCISPPPLLSCQLQKRKRREHVSLKSYENVFPNSFLFPYAAEIVSADLHQYLTGMDMIHLRELVAVH